MTPPKPKLTAAIRGKKRPTRAHRVAAAVRKPARKAKRKGVPSRPLEHPDPDLPAHPLGRPSKWHPELARRICETVAEAIAIKVACRMHGLSRSALYEWRRRGEAGEAPYAGFVADLDTALARSEATLVRRVQLGSLESWRAAAWLLEKRFPARYGQRQTLRVEKAPREMDDAELERAIAEEYAQLKRQGLDPAPLDVTAPDDPVDADRLADLRDAVRDDLSSDSGLNNPEL